MPKIRQKITPFLWFDTQAEEAARFYTAVFPDSRIVSISHYPEAVPDKAGTVMVVTFDLAGQQFHALNAGPQHQFNQAVSMMVECETQEEIDALWARLTADGGEELPCGWLTDRFGLSWQITPTLQMELISGEDREAASKAMLAMFAMKKFIIADIERAVESLPKR